MDRYLNEQLKRLRTDYIDFIVFTYETGAPENFKYFNNTEMFDKVEEEKLLYNGLEGKASK